MPTVRIFIYLHLSKHVLGLYLKQSMIILSPSFYNSAFNITLSFPILCRIGRCTCEIKSRIAMAKTAFSKKKTLFTSKLDFNLRKKLTKMLHLEHGFLWC